MKDYLPYILANKPTSNSRAIKDYKQVFLEKCSCYITAEFADIKEVEANYKKIVVYNKFFSRI